LWRLAWALPLVLALGVAGAWAAARLGAARAPREAGARLRVVESVTVSEGLRVHLLELDGRSIAVAESALHVAQLGPRGDDPPAPRTREQSAARLRRLLGKTAR
jgi:hypothetical protein